MGKAEQSTRIFIDSIEPKLESLWETLSILKSYKGGNSVDKLMNFQHELAQCLADINKKYLEISGQKKTLRKERKAYEKLEFEKIDKDFTLCLEVLKQLIYLTKSIGDAFVWFFYQNEREMLNQHLERQEQFLLPSGFQGRLGELEFVRKFKAFENNIVLYHGITNILRISDYSLINLQTLKLTGISELKTNDLSNDLLELSLYTFGPKNEINDLFEKKESQKLYSSNNNQSKSYEERLEKQIKDITSALSSCIEINESHKETMVGISFLEQLEQLIIDNCEASNTTFKVVGEGLIIAVIRQEGKKLSENLFGNLDRSLELKDRKDFTEAYTSILDLESDQNNILVNPILYNNEGKMSFSPGTKPLFWTPLSPNISKQIYFQEVIAITIYNPLFFKRKLENRDFKFEHIEQLKKLCLINTNCKPNIVIENWAYFLALITNHLLEEDAVFEIIDKYILHVQNSNFQSNTKVGLKFYQA